MKITSTRRFWNDPKSINNVITELMHLELHFTTVMVNIPYTNEAIELKSQILVLDFILI